MKKRNNVFKFKGDSKCILQFNVMNHCIIRKYPQPWEMTEDQAWFIGWTLDMQLPYCWVFARYTNSVNFVDWVNL